MLMLIYYGIFIMMKGLDCSPISIIKNGTHEMDYDTDYILKYSLSIALSILIVLIIVAIFCYIIKDLKQIVPIELTTTNEINHLNAMMLALASSDKLLENLNDLLNDVPNNQKLATFVHLLQKIKQQKKMNNILENKDDLQTLIGFVGWDPNLEQDTLFLLELVINNIEEEILDILTEKKKIIIPKFRVLQKYNESNLSNQVHSHLALMLPLCGHFNEKPGVFLERLLDKYFEFSTVDESSNETQIFFFQEAPEVLILHIQSKEWIKGEYTQLTYNIIYNDILEYIFEIKQNIEGTIWNNVRVTYQLMAVVHHMGSISGGHYITYRRHGQTWYLTNDTQVEEVSFKCDIVPYIMVYEKLDENVF